jgi:UDP:flavonoid glycosyltransferase YjiC (YdhE family)
VLASTDRRLLDLPGGVPANATLVDWIPYGRTMPRCDAVVCHAGHGTIALALRGGCVPVCVPAGGDMNETSARVDWAGAGVRLPRRLARPRPVALAVGRALSEPRLRARARELAAWAAANDAGARAAGLVERFAAGAA